MPEQKKQCKVFRWKGKPLLTMGDVCDAVVQCKTKADAESFMAEYRKITPHAEANVGYFTGYLTNAECRRIQSLFGVSHPIFGTTIPTPEEAFKAGVKWGKRMRRKITERDSS